MNILCLSNNHSFYPAFPTVKHTSFYFSNNAVQQGHTVTELTDTEHTPKPFKQSSYVYGSIPIKQLVGGNIG